MAMPLKMIIVGTGGWGGAWCREFLPPNIASGRVEVVGAVDIDPSALANAREHLKLRENQCFSDVRTAFDTTPADCCAIVVPPAFHEQVVDEAIRHSLHVLSEKPIADTLEASVRIAYKVERAGLKMGVTMSHRFDQDKSTLRALLQSGNYGRLDYLVCRFTCDCRKFASWGKFRHEMADPLLIEGAVHHLDILADLAGSPCDVIYADSWNPKWGEYRGDSQALVTMRMENGVRVQYEGAKSNAVGLNGWTREYIRAECENATLVLSDRSLTVYPYDASGSWRSVNSDETVQIDSTLLEQAAWANTWLIEKFACWVANDGPQMETDVRSNLQSVALVFGAIESSRTGKPVHVQELLQNTITSERNRL